MKRPPPAGRRFGGWCRDGPASSHRPQGPSLRGGSGPAKVHPYFHRHAGARAVSAAHPATGAVAVPSGGADGRAPRLKFLGRGFPPRSLDPISPTRRIFSTGDSSSFPRPVVFPRQTPATNTHPSGAPLRRQGPGLSGRQRGESLPSSPARPRPPDLPRAPRGAWFRTSRTRSFGPAGTGLRKAE